MSRQGPREAYVQISELPGMQQVFVPTKRAINRAVHGDTVAGPLPHASPPPPQVPYHELHCQRDVLQKVRGLEWVRLSFMSHEVEGGVQRRYCALSLP